VKAASCYMFYLIIVIFHSIGSIIGDRARVYRSVSLGTIEEYIGGFQLKVGVRCFSGI